MADDKKPVVIEQTSTKSTSNKKSSYIRDSASRVIQIAQVHELDALLQDEKPQKSALERAINRQKKRQEQRQKNLEQILKFAHASCNNETAGEPDADWLHRFFDMAQDIHNSSMQKLWSQVLKREITNPGSTSMKALQVLKDMSPREAQNLQRAASLACSFGSDNSKKLLLGFKSKEGFFGFYKKENTSVVNMGTYQLPYSSLLHLIELGLVLGTELESGEVEFDPALMVSYQGKNIALQPMSKGIRLLYYRFTPTGDELCRLLGNKPNTNYYDQLLALLAQKFTVQTEAGSNVNQSV
ncbi:TIGR03899 family protein [Vibrio nigripulchritudo]|uniref:TIGR03899 family protein n=1 Tax=Vibrio nigripulchritudo TaxID=28173 RepID=UPI00190E2896|nr:TIGR03899 family protein [Vibrio nigripulchritudo]BCL68413.1 TIGR03899 family protein [Vibrio nigripulchritudo]BDU29741.1 TIGR03899 family protein [Vibrio nigripulchritudo]